MLTPYLVLDLDPAATDGDIRKRYLELVRRHPPGQDPERFRRIAKAYEQLVDERARIHTRVVGFADFSDFALALDQLATSRLGQRSQRGLAALIESEGLSDD